MPAIEALSLYRAADLVGRPFAEFVHPDELESMLASLQRTVAGAREPTQFRVLDRDGRVRWVRTFGRPVLDAGGTLRALRGVMTEVTALVEAEEAYRLVFEHSQQGLAVVQGNHIRLAHPALAELTGYAPAKLTATARLDLTRALVHIDDLPRMLAAADAFIEGRARAPGFEFRLVRRDGAVRHVLTTNSSCLFRGEPARRRCSSR